MPAVINVLHSDLTVTKPAPTGLGTVLCTLNLGTYATNGIDVDIANIRAGLTLLAFTCALSADGTTAYVYNPATAKVRAFVVATGAEVANAVDLSAAGKHCVCEIRYREGNRANAPGSPITL
jgi:hypothetical protein